MLFRTFSILVVLCPLSLVYAAPTGSTSNNQAPPREPHNCVVWFGYSTVPPLTALANPHVPANVDKGIRDQLIRQEGDTFRYLNDFPPNGIDTAGMFTYWVKYLPKGYIHHLLGFTAE
ncbi:hypothetical protein F5880DRAFT_1599723 [Lentinula raphanica]|nr:hypothetical protein F5880DRAFT_1599723 [Lentinula raphanica]